VAALALARALEGREVTDRVALGRVARRGHREAQGGGSGVDVLASACGGVLRVTLGDAVGDEPTVALRAWPSHWPWAVLWTGVSARTSELLARVATLEARESAWAGACWQGIARATEDLDRAMDTGDVRSAVDAVQAHARWMSELGQRAGVGIVTEPLGRFTADVVPLGVGVKPSGAGGGDVALVIGQDDATLAEALRRANGAGFKTVDLMPDADGVQVFERAMEDR
jgi:phosphomevalonate kinase